MNSVELSEISVRDDLFPFTLSRTVLDIRVGILTLKEKWEKRFQYQVGLDNPDTRTANLIPANLIPDDKLIKCIKEGKDWDWIKSHILDIRKIQYPWHIFQNNAEEIGNDFRHITLNRVSKPLSKTNRVFGSGDIFLEDGAVVEHAILNATAGPIYLGPDTEIMEGSCIRGPFALCQGAKIKMGTMIYGGTTIGPNSVMGGEIKNAVIFGNSNKAHHGYLGDAVIAEWCNLGAGSSNSNLQNNAGEVKVWNEPRKTFLSAGIKCGLFMGDYSKSAINTTFNTGTVTGICCNIFGSGLTPKHIPSFSWGYGNFPPYAIERALEDIDNWKQLKNERITDMEVRTLKLIFEQIPKLP